MISKQSAVSCIVEADASEIQALEAKIDRAIKVEYAPGHMLNVTVSRVSRRVVEQIIANYTKGGWTIKFHDDQRDGQWFSLK